MNRAPFREWLIEVKSPELTKYNKIEKLKLKIKNKSIINFLNENLSLKYHPKDYSAPYKKANSEIIKLSSKEINFVYYSGTVQLTNGYMEIFENNDISLRIASNKRSSEMTFIYANTDDKFKTIKQDLKLLGDILVVLEFSKLDIYYKFVELFLEKSKPAKASKPKTSKRSQEDSFGGTMNIDFDDAVDILYKNITSSKHKEAYLINHSDVREFLDDYNGYTAVKTVAEFKSKIKDLDHIIDKIRNEY